MRGQYVSTVLELAMCPATADTARRHRRSPGFLIRATPATGPNSSRLAPSNVTFLAVPEAPVSAALRLRNVANLIRPNLASCFLRNRL